MGPWGQTRSVPSLLSAAATDRLCEASSAFTSPLLKGPSRLIFSKAPNSATRRSDTWQ